jgi:hypothetical protein
MLRAALSTGLPGWLIALAFALLLLGGTVLSFFEEDEIVPEKPTRKHFILVALLFVTGLTLTGVTLGTLWGVVLALIVGVLLLVGYGIAFVRDRILSARER